MTGEQNLRLIREIEANREFLLMAYSQNPSLLAKAEPRIRELLQTADASMGAEDNEVRSGTLHHLSR